MPPPVELAPTSEQFDLQKGEWISSTLDHEEQSLLDCIVQWKNVPSIFPSIEQLHGRSFVLRSPTRHCSVEQYMRGEFDGLQIIGAGGTQDMLRDGVYSAPAKFNLSPVDEKNHADMLEDILEQRWVDENGILQTEMTQYAPLHGMLQNEASHRKNMTERLSSYVKPTLESNAIPLYTVPELAGEGQFVNKFDESGNNLCFQVYRVPLVQRFPGQLVDWATRYGMEIAEQRMNAYQYKTGMLLDHMAQERIAYIDGHLGNMSLLVSPQLKRTNIYITDLESCIDYKSHNFPQRYRALDMYVMLQSAAKFYDSYTAFMLKDNPSAKKYSTQLLFQTTVQLLSGIERNKMKLSNTVIKEQDIASRVTLPAIRILEEIVHPQDPQSFLEFFENLFTTCFE